MQAVLGRLDRPAQAGDPGDELLLIPFDPYLVEPEIEPAQVADLALGLQRSN